jgi:hypothetical protein
VAGDPIGELTHKRAELAQFLGQRIDRAARPVHRGADIGLDRIQPPPDLRHLLGEVGGTAREVGDPVTHLTAAQAVAHSAVHGHADERGHRRNRGSHAVELEGEERMPPDAIRTMHSAMKYRTQPRMPRDPLGSRDWPDSRRR